jgi:prepilin-type N-terminal cleavage/methylation domain-containing protein
MTRKNGLTLLELIVVVIIIAIGASLALPNFRKGADQKRADSAIAGLRAMSYCLRIYVQEHGGVLPAGTKWGHLDSEGVIGEAIIGNGCYDRDQFEKTYTFPARNADISYNKDVPATVIAASDKRSVRTVCLVPAGTPDRRGNVYDLPSGSCDSEPSDGWYRKMPE